MKVTNLKKRARPSQGTAASPKLFVDEFHLLSKDLAPLPRHDLQLDSPPKFIATQTVLQDKRGKLIISGRMRDARTGMPIPPAPKKFFPAQVLRRQSAAME